MPSVIFIELRNKITFFVDQLQEINLKHELCGPPAKRSNHTSFVPFELNLGHLTHNCSELELNTSIL